MGINTYFTKPNKAVGVHLILGSSQQVYNLTVLSSKNQKVITEKHVGPLSSIKEVQAEVASELPIALVIQGKGILHKLIPFADSESDFASTLELVKNAWPTINAQDFYFQRYSFAGGIFLSVIRRSLLEDVLEEFKKANIDVLDVKLGTFAISCLKPVIETTRQVIHIGEEEIVLSDGEVIEVKATKTTGAESALLVGDELIAAQWLLSYSVALNELILKEENPVLFAKPVEVAIKEWEQKRLFRKRGLAFLFFWLILLGVNFLLFSHYNNQNQVLRAQSEGVAEKLEYLGTLKQKYTEQESFLNSVGWQEVNRGAFYADRLAATVPAKIQLTEVSIHPVDVKSTKSKRKLVVEPGVILVKGLCQDPQTLNSWLQDLPELDWVRNIKGQSYSYNHNQKTGNFEYKIVIRE